MMKVLYYFLAWPFIITAKIAEFVTWEILDTRWKNEFRFPRRPVNQDQSAYIQHLLKKNVEEKRRADDLHVYYQRQMKIRDEENRRRKKL